MNLCISPSEAILVDRICFIPLRISKLIRLKYLSSKLNKLVIYINIKSTEKEMRKRKFLLLEINTVTKINNAAKTKYITDKYIISYPLLVYLIFLFQYEAFHQ